MTSNTIITEVGLAKIAAAIAAKTTVKLTTFAVGDGNYAPTGKETKLRSEKYRKLIDSASSDPENKDTLLLNTVIPENVGGWYIREYGIFDDVGDLIAIGIANETYKPAPDDVKAVTISFTARVKISNIEVVEFNIRLDGYADVGYVNQQDELIKKWTDKNYQIKLNYMPIQQGGGIDQLGNKIYIGYSSDQRIKVTVDKIDYGNLVTDNVLNSGALPAQFKTLKVSGETRLNSGVIEGKFTAPTPAITDTTAQVANMTAINNAVTQIASINFSAVIDGVLSITEAQARRSGIVIGGVLTSDVNIQLPAIAKTYFIYINGSLGGFSLTVSSTTGIAQPLYVGGNLLATNGTTTLYRLSALYNTNFYGNSYYNYDIATNDKSYRIANTAHVSNALTANGKGITNNSTALNSYDVYASGRIIQRGAISVPKNTYVALTFPITFPNNCLNFQCTASYQDESTDVLGAYFNKNSLTTSGVNVGAYDSNGNPRTLMVYWTAIGN
ncbi:MAG: phage tail protein [Burkholderiales bacterium]|nr:phage tail protein [Burkholderiales bacterium]